MRKYLAMVLIASLVVMLIQQVTLTATVRAEAPQPPIYPSKDKFFEKSIDNTDEVRNGEGGNGRTKNYVGYDFYYGEHSTYLHYSLTGIETSRTLESVKLIIPILTGYVSRAQSNVDPYVNVYGSVTDAWSEAGTTTSDLPTYNAANDFLGKQSFNFTGSSGGLLLEFDVTTFIKGQLGALDNQASFVLTGPTAADINAGATTGARQNIIMLDDRESGKAGRPYLEYVYAPNEPPTGTLTIKNGDLYTNSTDIMLNTTYTDPENDNVEMQFSNDNTIWSEKEAFNSSKSWRLSNGDGPKTVYMKLTDVAGNTAVFSDTIILDTIAPAGSVSIEGDKSHTNKTNVNLTIVSADTHAVQMRFSNTGSDWDDSGWAAAAASRSWALTTGDGEKTVYMQLRDAAGNMTQYNDTIVVDTVLPVVTGVSDGDKLNHDVTVSFNKGTATLNGSAFTSRSSVSAEGSHTLVVTDTAGNATTINFGIDKTAPLVSGVANSGFYNSDRHPVYSDNNAGVSATLNGAAFAGGSSVSAEGSYTLVVTDAYGNAVTVIFTIDKTLPNGSIVINGGDAATTVAGVRLTISGTDAYPVEMRLSGNGTDWGIWRTVASLDWTLSAGFGEKTVYLELRDASGNVSAFTDRIVYRSVPALTDSSVNGTEDTAYSFINTDFKYSNADGKTLNEIKIVTLPLPANGKLQLNGTDIAVNETIAVNDISNLQFVPAPNWFGQTTFEWTASAEMIAASDSAVMTITIAAVNDAPTADNLPFSTAASAKIDGQLIANDIEHDPLTYSIIDQPAKGALTLNTATGTFSFVPEAGHYNDVTFTYKANDGHADSNTATVTIKNNRPPSSGNGSPVLPSIKIEGLGSHPGVKVEVVIRDGKKVLVGSLDGNKLADLIKQLNDGELTIDVGTTAENVELAMDLELIKQLEKGKATFKLVVGGTGYGLSSSAIREVMKGWSNANAQLKIEIKQADPAASKKLEEIAADKGYKLLVTPMSYQLYFQTGDSRVNLSSIKGYITISYGEEQLNGKNPKTAVLLLPNGKLVHVPTKISNKDGQFEIKVHSFANGVFALIDFEKKFEDVSGWSQPYIEELASRLIIQGTGNSQFEPNRSVTRAEFAVIITGALGLYSETGGRAFSDVSPDDWFAASLTAASEFGLISGYSDGSFRPDENISREEAMVILARAISLMELVPNFTQAELDAGLASFGDKAELSDWSESAAGLTVLLGIVNGSDNELNPAEPMTREQLAAVIVRLLQKGHFI